MDIRIPEPLKLEHQELHEELVRATKASGRIGEAAKAVAAVLHPHFVKEEEYALPPLGLLSALATGSATPPTDEVLTMTSTTALEPETCEAITRMLRAETTTPEDLFNSHDLREEHVLYPMADRLMTSDDRIKLIAAMQQL
jgi:hypothetical protein